MTPLKWEPGLALIPVLVGSCSVSWGKGQDLAFTVFFILWIYPRLKGPAVLGVKGVLWSRTLWSSYFGHPLFCHRTFLPSSPHSMPF